MFSLTPKVFRGALAVFVLVTGTVMAVAQGLEITAGASSLTGVNGITLENYNGERTSMLSFGETNQGLAFGAATEVKRGNGILRYGDTMMGFTLPTDLDSAGRGVGARGVQWTHVAGNESWSVFAGKTGNTLEFGYLNSIDPAHWVSSLEWTKQLSAKVGVQGIAAVGAAHAALLSMTYQANPRSIFAVTTGWNAGRPIIAMSAKMQGATWKAQVSETLGRLQLRPDTNVPLALNQFYVPEREGINFAVEKRIFPWLDSDVERVAYAKDLVGGLPDGAQMYDAGLTANEGTLSQGVRLLQSRDGGESEHGVAMLAQYMHSHWSVNTAVMESWRESPENLDNGRMQSVTVSASRDFMARYKVTAGADFASGTPNFIAGGEMRGPWGSVGVSENVVYVPFGPMSGFTRVTEISLQLHPWGVVQGSVDVVMGKNVPWSYTSVANAFIEHGGGDGEHMRFRQAEMSVPQYVLRGVVVDQEGHPVGEAAVRVGDQMVYTNDQGQWEYRQRRPIPVSVEVQPDDFMTLRRYVTATAGTKVTPQRDGEAKPVVMHVFYQKATRQMLTEPVAGDHAAGGSQEDGTTALEKKHWDGLMGTTEEILLRGGTGD